MSCLGIDMYKFTYDDEYFYNTYKELCQGMFYGLCEGCREEAEMEGIEMSPDQMLLLGCYVDCASWEWLEIEEKTNE